MRTKHQHTRCLRSPVAKSTPHSLLQDYRAVVEAQSLGCWTALGSEEIEASFWNAVAWPDQVPSYLYLHDRHVTYIGKFSFKGRSMSLLPLWLGICLC